MLVSNPQFEPFIETSLLWIVYTVTVKEELKSVKTKKNEGRRLTVRPKWAVLQLLHRLHAAMEGKWSDLAKAGFRACGIYPLNPRVVYSKHYAVDAQGENVSQAPGGSASSQ